MRSAVKAEVPDWKIHTTLFLNLFYTQVSLMNTRYIANPDTRSVREFMRTNRRKERPEDRQSRIAKFAFASVLVVGIATSIPFKMHSRKTPSSIEVNGSSAMMQKGFCAVKCSRSGNGAFYSNDIVYVEDWSDGKRYWKRFYDKKEKLLVEGVGNKSDRWFFNPDYKGKAHLANAIRIGNEWQTINYYTGDDAVTKWNEARVKY